MYDVPLSIGRLTTEQGCEQNSSTPTFFLSPALTPLAFAQVDLKQRYGTENSDKDVQRTRGGGMT